MQVFVQPRICIDCGTTFSHDEKCGPKQQRCVVCREIHKTRIQKRGQLRRYWTDKNLLSTSIGISKKHQRFIRRSCLNLSQVVRKHLDELIKLEQQNNRI